MMTEIPIELFPSSCSDAVDAVDYFFKNANRLGPGKYKDYDFFPFFPFDTVRYVVEDWEPRDTDIVISVYPKCGTHWTIDIVRSILYSRDPRLDKMSKQIPTYLFDLEMGPVEKFKVLDSLNIPRRFFGTHLSGDLFPLQKALDKNVKILRILRNPKDRLLSMYLFMQNFMDIRNEANKGHIHDDWNAYFDDYVAGRYNTHLRQGETYGDHILSWLPYHKHENVKCMYFEDMKKNLPKAVADIAEFIGVELSEEDVSDISHQTGFERAFATMQDGSNTRDVHNKRRNILRKGLVGGWKTSDLMTAKQAETIDGLIERKLAETGITFTYEL